MVRHKQYYGNFWTGWSAVRRSAYAVHDHHIDETPISRPWAYRLVWFPWLTLFRLTFEWTCLHIAISGPLAIKMAVEQLDEHLRGLKNAHETCE